MDWSRLFPFLLCVFSLSATAETVVRIASIDVSPNTAKAVSQWVAQAMAVNGPALHVLLKESKEGTFTKEELNEWWASRNPMGKNEAKEFAWNPSVHGSKIVWQNENSVGCVVHVPTSGTYAHEYGELPQEWVVWHELSHCVWPMNGLREEWWQILTLSNGVGVELGEVQEESWSDAWALWLSKKHLQISDEQIIEWMRFRTTEALKCKCLGHWTNTTVSFGLAAFKGSYEGALHEIQQWMKHTTLQAEDLDWLKWNWSGRKKKVAVPSNLWLKANAALIVGNK